MYGNATGFHTLILYLQTLLKSFISPSNLLAKSLGFSKFRIISPGKRDIWTSFSIWMSFIPTKIKMDNEGHCIMIKIPNKQEDLSTQNIYTPVPLGLQKDLDN